MYEHVGPAGLEPYDVKSADARVKAAGCELRPRKMYPSVWLFDAGGLGSIHYQREQEELYHVLSGTFELIFAGDDGGETGALDLELGGFVVVSLDEVRQLRCVETGEVFVVNASDMKDDDVVVRRAGGSPFELVGNATRTVL